MDALVLAIFPKRPAVASARSIRTVGIFAALGDVVEHRRYDAARTACRSCHHDTSRRILLGGGERIGIEFRPAAERVVETFGFDHIGAGFAPYLQSAGQDAFVVQSAFDGFAHRRPYRGEKLPDVVSFVIFHVFPERFAFGLAPFQYLLDGGERIDIDRLPLFRMLVGQCSAPYAENGPCLFDLSSFQGLVKHTVGMERQDRFRFPYHFGRRDRFEYRKDGGIREVPLAGSRQRTV